MGHRIIFDTDDYIGEEKLNELKRNFGIKKNNTLIRFVLNFVIQITDLQKEGYDEITLKGKDDIIAKKGDEQKHFLIVRSFPE